MSYVHVLLPVKDGLDWKLPSFDELVRAVFVLPHENSDLSRHAEDAKTTPPISSQFLSLAASVRWVVMKRRTEKRDGVIEQDLWAKNSNRKIVKEQTNFKSSRSGERSRLGKSSKPKIKEKQRSEKCVDEKN